MSERHDNNELSSSVMYPSPIIQNRYCTTSQFSITIQMKSHEPPVPGIQLPVVGLELWVRGRETWREIPIHTYDNTETTTTITYDGALEAAGQELHIKCRAKYTKNDFQEDSLATTPWVYSEWTEESLIVTTCPKLKRRKLSVTPDPIVGNSSSDEENTIMDQRGGRRSGVDPSLAYYVTERTITIADDEDEDSFRGIHNIDTVQQQEQEGIVADYEDDNKSEDILDDDDDLKPAAR